MLIIDDNELVDKLYNKYRIEKLFNINIKDELFLAKYEKGDFICQEGDSLKYLHLMVDGKIKVSVTQENGKSRLICFLEGFEMLGYVEFFAETDYSTDVEAMTDVYCFVLDLSTHKNELLNDILFLRYTAIKVSKNLLENNENASFNLLYPLETRLATYILLTAKGIVFQDNLTTVAELLTTSYRHLTRVLAKFCDKGMLVKKSNYHEIVDFEKLKKVSNQSITHL